MLVIVRLISNPAPATWQASRGKRATTGRLQTRHRQRSICWPARTDAPSGLISGGQSASRTPGCIPAPSVIQHSSVATGETHQPDSTRDPVTSKIFTGPSHRSSMLVNGCFSLGYAQPRDKTRHPNQYRCEDCDTPDRFVSCRPATK